MSFLMKMTNQIGQIIKSQSAARRLLLLAIVMGSVCAMVALTLHTRTGGYVVLFTGMQAGDAGEAIGKLRQMGIEARLENGGTTIKVPRNRSDEAAMMMAMEGIPSSGIVGFELMDKNSLGQTKFQQEKNYLRMREGELARTLLSLREIERARVHLALPENVLFAQDSERPTASVVIKLHNGAALTDKQVSGIIHLVSHSVEGLQPEDVSIIDNLGNLLNESRLPEGATLTLTQNNFKTQYEDLLKSRIETMLEKVVGKGKVAARVQADFDFSTSREVKEIYNPDDQDPIKVSERTQTEVDKSPGSAVAVTPPPTATPAAAQGTVPAGATNSQLTTEYAVSKMKQETEQMMPMPKRVSVAVLVDGVYEAAASAAKGASEQKSFRPRAPEEMTKLENLVKATIGYDETRQDDVKVECSQFTLDETTDFKDTGLSYESRRMIELGVQWGVTGLVGLLLILVVLRPAMKQILVRPDYMALPGAALAGGETDGGETDPFTGETAPPAIEGGIRTQDAQAALASAGLGGPMFDKLMKQSVDFPSIPPPGSDKALQLQHMAAQQAKFTRAQSQKVHKEVVDTAKNDPHKTVSLLRQWLDEA